MCASVTMDFKVLTRHDRSNPWCRFPRMKCVCVETSNYERLDEVSLESVSEKDYLNEKEEELFFYNDDGSCHSVLVEKNLCTSDLCQLLAVKNTVSKSVSWSIIEHWTDQGLERLLEDHESVLMAYRDIKMSSRNAQVKYIFRKEYRKYEFFHNPQQFFPPEMLGITNEFRNTSSSNFLNLFLRGGGICPPFMYPMWIKDQRKKTWTKGFLILKDNILYYSHKLQSTSKVIRASKLWDSPISEGDGEDIRLLANLSHHYAYTTFNARNQFKAPTEWGICLRPSDVDTEDEHLNLTCIACESERIRTCWIAAMRLAKYGKQLRENYRAFKNKQNESMSPPKEYNSYTVPNESVRSRVAMDFTGSVGRIVEDPKEAKAIAAAEGYSWKRRWRPPRRLAPNSISVEGLESGIHITQPWFHSGMSRDQATQLVNKHGTVDGVFLVRQSHSNPGAFVLTYKCGGKVIHAQITPILDPIRESYVFSLDSGVTKFYDLLQLVEFYQLNAGCLPTRLTHYVVQNSSPINTPSNNVPSKNPSTMPGNI